MSDNTERAGKTTMISQMHLVQNAARMAMADHRAAAPRRARSGGRALLRQLVAAIAAIYSRLFR